MTISHGVHLHRQPRVRHQKAIAAPKPGPGEPTALGGRVLLVGAIGTAVLWVVSLIELIRLPDEVLMPMGTAIWTGLAISCGLAAFLMGIWKAHRA